MAIIYKKNPFVIYADTCRTCFWSTSNYIPIIDCPGKWHEVGPWVNWLAGCLIKSYEKFLIFNPKLKLWDDAQILKRTFTHTHTHTHHRCKHFSKEEKRVYTILIFLISQKRSGLITTSSNLNEKLEDQATSAFTCLLLKSTFSCLFESNFFFLILASIS